MRAITRNSTGMFRDNRFRNLMAIPTEQDTVITKGGFVYEDSPTTTVIKPVITTTEVIPTVQEPKPVSYGTSPFVYQDTPAVIKPVILPEEKPVVLTETDVIKTTSVQPPQPTEIIPESEVAATATENKETVKAAATSQLSDKTKMLISSGVAAGILLVLFTIKK